MRSEAAGKEERRMGHVLIPVAVGLLVGLLGSLSMLLLFSAVLTVQDVPQAAVSTLAAVAVAFGCFCGAFAAARMRASGGLLTGAATGLLLYLLLLLMGLVFQRQSPAAPAFVKLGIALLAGGVGGVTGINFGKRH